MMKLIAFAVAIAALSTQAWACQLINGNFKASTYIVDFQQHDCSAMHADWHFNGGDQSSRDFALDGVWHETYNEPNFQSFEATSVLDKGFQDYWKYIENGRLTRYSRTTFQLNTTGDLVIDEYSQVAGSSEVLDQEVVLTRLGDR